MAWRVWMLNMPLHSGGKGQIKCLQSDVVQVFFTLPRRMSKILTFNNP